MAAKKTQKQAAGSDSNASDFVRSQPLAMTAPDLVAAGKKAGFEFSTSLVYAVRGRMKRAGAGPARAASEAAEPRAARRAPRAASVGKLDDQIRALVDSFTQQMTTLVRKAALEAVSRALDSGR
ncbi:MAG: hypothetical protein FJ104_00520 [Deltaproteobacteria bacterium]|nr:hypothetical protein [Deltaproteobacteria bacterium]